MTDPRYPTGPYVPNPFPDGSDLAAWIDVLAATPARLRSAVRGLDDAQLDTSYRVGGWTLRQVAHHVPDSHLNAYVRFKLALTEETPLVKDYEESRWAELPDARAGSIEPSLALLESLHERWVRLLRALGPADFAREFRHPAYEAPFTLGRTLGLYAWHGPHHTAQITTLRSSRGW
ncbi:MAG: YfiT family bacillithiol transferase [Candidatus Eisenbacteria bacterium]